MGFLANVLPSMKRNKLENANIDIILHDCCEISKSREKSPINCPCVADGLSEHAETIEMENLSNRLSTQPCRILLVEIAKIDTQGPRVWRKSLKLL